MWLPTANYGICLLIFIGNWPIKPKQDHRFWEDMSLVHTVQNPTPPLAVGLAMSQQDCYCFPEPDLSSFPAGTLALTRLSYPFSLLSTPKERWNSPQLMNNLQAREKGKCKDPTQVLVKGKQWESKVRNTHLISSNLTASLKFLKHRLLGVEHKVLRWFTQKLNHHGRVLPLPSQIKSTDCQNTEKSRDEVLYLHANE